MMSVVVTKHHIDLDVPEMPADLVEKREATKKAIGNVGERNDMTGKFSLSLSRLPSDVDQVMLKLSGRKLLEKKESHCFHSTVVQHAYDMSDPQAFGHSCSFILW